VVSLLHDYSLTSDGEMKRRERERERERIKSFSMKESKMNFEGFCREEERNNMRSG
jgi:hypothetical protein